MIALLTVLVLVRMYRMSPCDLGTGTSRYDWLVLCVVKEWLAVSRSEHLLCGQKSVVVGLQGDQSRMLCSVDSEHLVEVDRRPWKQQ